jgi:hypothetical protein
MQQTGMVDIFRAPDSQNLNTNVLCLKEGQEASGQKQQKPNLRQVTCHFCILAHDDLLHEITCKFLYNDCVE